MSTRSLHLGFAFALSLLVACAEDTTPDGAMSCTFDCDCPQGSACVDSTCERLATPIYCCERTLCPQGELCVNERGSAGVCPECAGPCDCPQGEACSSQGTCIATSTPSGCCQREGCPLGESCIDLDGTESTCAAYADGGVVIGSDAGSDAGFDAGDAGFDAGFDAGPCAPMPSVCPDGWTYEQLAMGHRCSIAFTPPSGVTDYCLYAESHDTIGYSFPAIEGFECPEGGRYAPNDTGRGYCVWDRIGFPAGAVTDCDAAAGTMAYSWSCAE